MFKECSSVVPLKIWKLRFWEIADNIDSKVFYLFDRIDTFKSCKVLKTFTADISDQILA